MDNTSATVKSAVTQIKKSDLFISLNMEMGCSSGLPTLGMTGGRLCLTVPYLKYKITGVKDKTLVYPIRYVLTVTYPELVPVSFTDLRYLPEFSKIDFTKPVGYFRHEAVKNCTRAEYEKLRDRLFACYDIYAGHLMRGSRYPEKDRREMKRLMNIVAEPSLYPLYKAIAPGFYNMFMAEDDLYRI